MSTYDYIKYPEDRLYLRVGELIRQLMYSASKVGNLEAYGYLSTIQNNVSIRNKPESQDIKKIEKHLTSPEFLNQKCFRNSDRENMRPIIREYKLNMLV
jgi:hypothetical protein